MATVDLDKKKALGKGLASLIPGTPVDSIAAQARKEFFLCDIEKIIPNTYQPRKIFQKEALDELVDSVKTHGIIQPLIVRRKGGQFELIAGERRWRAAQRVGMHQVPVVVKEDPGDGASLEMAIIENVQREDLNCVEEAMAYQQLVDEFQLSQEEIANRVGKNRATVANTLRLLKLPAVIREDLTTGKMTMGHARAILSLERNEDQVLVRELILKKKLSVRDTERKVAELLKGKQLTHGSGKRAPDANLAALEENLKRQFGTMVQILGNENQGLIQFTYVTKDDLMRLVDRLQAPKEALIPDVSTTHGPI